MAEEEIIGNLLSGAASFGSGTLDIILYIVLAAIVILFTGFIVWLLSFKHKIRIRYQTKNGSYILDDRARRRKKDGVIYWQFLKQKISAVPPPRKAINITKKGNLVAECYITEDNPEPVWLVDRGFKHKENFRPVTTQQRALIVSRIRKAESRKGKSLWENIRDIAIPMTMVMMVAIPFLFWGDITKSSENAMQQASVVSARNAEISEQNARMMGILAGKVDIGELQVNQNIPQEEQEIIGGGG